jgi:hypothetical protein
MDEDTFVRKASCHVGATDTHLTTKVKQRWSRLELGGLTQERAGNGKDSLTREDGRLLENG